MLSTRENRMTELEKELDKLRSKVINDIENDTQFKNQIKEFGVDYKLNSFKIFNLISNKLSESEDFNALIIKSAMKDFIVDMQSFASVEDMGFASANSREFKIK